MVASGTPLRSNDLARSVANTALSDPMGMVRDLVRQPTVKKALPIIVILMVVAAFGLAGYLFYKLGCEPAPLLLGFVLGPMMEEYLKRALKLARGDWSVFITRPLSAALLAVAVVLVVMVLLPAVKSKREEAFVED